MKRFAAVALLLATVWMQPASASLQNDGVWAGGVWASTVFAQDVWYEAAPGTPVPDVVGLSATDADTALTADGFVTGTITQQCSEATADTVLIQSPAAGVNAAAGSSVALWTSNGTACRSGNVHIGIRIGIGL